MGKSADAFIRNVNFWFANCTYAADVDLEGRYRVNLTPNAAPIAADADGILAATSVTAAGSTTTFVAAFLQTEAQMGKYGRCLSAVGSAASMAQIITVKGRDYLGQPVTEEITLNATTTVNGVKAFRWIDEVSWDGGTAGNLNLGFRDAFGVPYAVWATTPFTDFVNDVPAGTAGAVTARNTSTQTATTADPRGIYTPHSSSAANGSRSYTIMYEPYKSDLFGLAHYSA